MIGGIRIGVGADFHGDRQLALQGPQVVGPYAFEFMALIDFPVGGQVATDDADQQGLFVTQPGLFIDAGANIEEVQRLAGTDLHPVLREYRQGQPQYQYEKQRARR